MRSRPLDAFDAKADALAVLLALGAPTENLQVDSAAPPAWYHPGRCGALRLGPKVLGQFGELHPRVLKALGLRGPAVAFEVFLETLPEPKAKDGSLRPAPLLSPFQPLRRDFAFVVEESVTAEKLLRAAKGADKTLVADVELFDLYAGENLGPGKKSLAITVTLQPTDKTLTDEEIAAVSQKIVAKVEKATGGELRA
jgi:phenylalanyl-tRNA synthetase beta chain